MSLATVAGLGAVGAAYLNAKFHIRKDVSSLISLKATERLFAKAAASNRISLWYIFEEQVNRMPPEEEFIWSREGSITWKEGHRMASRYANYFQTLGAGPNELIAVYLQNRPEFVITNLAAWAIGTAPAMINYNLGGDGLIHCLKLSGSKILLVDEEEDVRKRIEAVRDRIENEVGMKIVIVDDEFRRRTAATSSARPPDSLRDNVKGEDPSMLLYTSGTTGFPKAVAFHIQRSYASASPRVDRLGVQPGPNGGRWYNPMPLYHGTGANVSHFCIFCGITLCIGKKFSVSTFWDDIRDSNATAFVYVGETARYLLAAPPSPRDKDHKVTMMFGNGLRPDIWEPFKERFGIETVSEFFNSTEGVFSLLNVQRGPFLSQSVGHHGALLRLLLRNTMVPVAVTDEGDIARDPATGFATQRPHHEGGEMLVAVPDTAAFAGYWKAPDATAKKFARDVFQKGDLWYRSGDSLRRDTDGRWFFLDRLGDTFRWKSENVSTAEVADALGRFPGIVEANVYGVLVPKHDGRAGCAALYIPPERRGSFDYKALLEFARAKLPRYAVPVFIRLATNVSPMHNNKLNKVPLRNEGVDLKKIKQGSNSGDTLLWVPPKGDRYVEFTEKDLEKLEGGQAKL